jgi:hypothetical protein
MGTLNMVAVPDRQLGRERAQSLVRTWAILRTLGSVKVLPDTTTEAELQKYLSENQVDLVLLPWSHYLGWSLIEGHFGIARNSGPTCAGYFAQPLDSREIGAINDYQRLIMLDFVHTSLSERWRLVRSLLDDKLRSGLEPLVQNSAPLYIHDWLGAEGPGPVLDGILSLDVFSHAPWRERIQPIELITLCLWNLAFERSRALSRGGWLDQLHAQKIQAHLQLTHDGEVLALRLCYKQSPNSPKAVLQDFWPDPDRTEDFRQTLIQQCDFLRVHPVAEQNEIEIVAGLLKSAPSRHRPGEFRTIWIDPISQRQMAPLAKTDPESSRVREILIPRKNSAQSIAAHVQWLEKEIRDRDAKIEELKAGGAELSSASKAAS